MLVSIFHFSFKEMSVYIYIYIYNIIIYIPLFIIYWYDTTIKDGTGNFAEIHQLTWGTAPTILQGYAGGRLFQENGLFMMKKPSKHALDQWQCRIHFLQMDLRRNSNHREYVNWILQPFRLN